MSAFKIAILAACSVILMLAAGCQGTLESVRAESKNAAEWPGPHGGLLAPFKEQAFRYRKPLEVSDGGRFMLAPYDELVDINKRDVQPVRKVRSWWVLKLPKGAEVEGEYEAGGRKLLYRAVGKLDGGSKITVIYVHGRGGSRDWGFDDERFGGNFNRLKNLMHKAGGAYVSPDFTDFEETGFADIKALINKFARLTDGPLVVACGSLGNTVCWNIAQDTAIASKISGLVVLAGFPDERFLTSPVIKSKRHHVPLLMAHGTIDPYYDYKTLEEFYRKIRAKEPDYPVRFVGFNTGKHGAPVRMIDWRDTLNWIAAQ
ncbi:MAG: alpha/beta hydrolase [Nitratireductor sp.]|nr:alpha/beta hydrolase [Nitratireductor sp.]